MATERVPLFDVDKEDCFSIKLMPLSGSSSDSIGPHSLPPNEESQFRKGESYITFNFDELGNRAPFDQSLRQQVVQKHITESNATFNSVRSYSTLGRSIPFTTDLGLPSANVVNPSGSRRFSSYESNQSEFLFEQFNERFGFEVDVPKKTWSQKLEDTKQFWMSQKLKASRDYLKSFFTKSKSKDLQINELKKSCSVRRSINTNMNEDGSKNHARRSFLSIFQRSSSSKSSSLCTLSSGFSSNVEVENSIEEAIAYCKQSFKK
ncbi:hypothetical protein RIF29_40057 [Crotalaria pallida]|uniref:Uncharacterized protein n=1 Tax=Crotalaria pallida TaxID=3830 RepID=A0AAN9HRA9_CROPI